jgi:uncharacterized protein
VEVDDSVGFTLYLRYNGSHAHWMKYNFLMIYFLSLLFINNCLAQYPDESSLTTTVLAHQFKDLHYSKPAKKKFLDLTKAGLLRKLNPVTYVGAGLLYFYQNVLSEQISADCTYQTSCSETTKKAIEKYGLIKGAILGIHQLGTCIPGNIHEHPSHLINEQGKIINEL